MKKTTYFIINLLSSMIALVMIILINVFSIMPKTINSFLTAQNSPKDWSNYKKIQYKTKTNIYYFKVFVLNYIKNLNKNFKTIPQKHLNFDIKIPSISNFKEIAEWLTKKNIVYSEGRYTIYIHPQVNFSKIFPEIVLKYPENSGFKIVKNFGEPDKIHYLTEFYAHNSMSLT
jgi:hypothetical protein